MVLMWQMAIFFLFTFVSFGIIILHEKGNIILYPKIEKELHHYFEKHYQTIQNEVIEGKLVYSFQEKSYSLLYQNQKNHDLSFELIYHKNKKITSTYQKDYVEGNQFLKKTTMQIQKEIEKILQENVSKVNIESTMTLDKMKSKTKKQLLKQPSKKIAFYEVQFTTTLLNLSAHEMQEKLKKIDALLEENECNPLYYQGKFVLQSDGTRGLILRNITRDIIQKGELETILNQLYQEEKTKDTNSGIEMEEIV